MSEAWDKLESAIQMRHSIMCEEQDGKRKFYRPKRDKNGAAYVRVGRVPGVRYQITEARLHLGDLICKIEPPDIRSE